MNIKLKSHYMIATLLAAGITLMSCSNDSPSGDMEGDSNERPDGGEIGGGITIPKEVLEKVKGIYSKVSLEPQKVTTVHEMAILTSVCATRQVAGPISITPSLLNGEEITLVTLGGTEKKEGQATTMKESQSAAFGKPNDYLTAVTRLFADGTVPKEKPVLVTGISLGGMIAQQLIADSLITADFELKAVITFGSPITMPVKRNGIKVVRFADEHDKVPKLGEMPLRMGMVSTGMSRKELKAHLTHLDETEKIFCTSQYTDMIETHALSYISEPCWDDVDFLGDPSKKNILQLTESMKFYPAPKLAE